MKMRVLALLAFCVVVSAGFPASSLAVDAETSTIPATTATATTAVAPTPATPLPVAADLNYRLVAEDVLRLDVWGEPQFSGMQMAVTPGGTITVPYLGEINVVGMTQTEVAQVIAKKLADAEIVLDAKVQVALLTLHRPQARVLGAVQRPGSFEYKEGDTILDAIAQGGSYADDAMLAKATLTHKGSDKAIAIDLKKMLAGDLSQNYPLQNGDAIYIPHEDYNNKFYVLGQVYKPGQYSLKDNTTLLSAISLAGGQTPRGAVKGTVIVRGDPKKPERVKCNLNRLFDKGDVSQDLVLQAGDIVIVPETKTPNWSNISTILNTIVNASYITRLGLF